MKRFKVYSTILALLSGIVLGQALIHLSILFFVFGVIIDIASLLVGDLAELTTGVTEVSND
ncbi:MAG: hypothetical protein ABF718_03195 [Leuconostoc pseudomesenteroides]|uniref:hypothetical protein n=1 Tax=Leuconostoc pseudomesenteroides TaxID=33968 RepID=UPI0039EAC01C